MKFWEAMKALEEGYTVHIIGEEDHPLQLNKGKLIWPDMDTFFPLTTELLEREWEISRELYVKEVWMRKIHSDSTKRNITWLQDVVTGQNMSCPYEKNPGFAEYKLYRVTIEEVDSE